MEEVRGSPLSKTPILRFQEKVNSTFIGVLQKKKEGKQKGSFIFEFIIEQGDVPTGKSTDAKDKKGRIVYEDCEVNEGDTVTLFGSTQLNDKIGVGVQEGERIGILYRGVVPNPKTGRSFNDYKVVRLGANEKVAAEDLKKD